MLTTRREGGWSVRTLFVQEAGQEERRAHTAVRYLQNNTPHRPLINEECKINSLNNADKESCCRLPLVSHRAPQSGFVLADDRIKLTHKLELFSRANIALWVSNGKYLKHYWMNVHDLRRMNTTV